MTEGDAGQGPAGTISRAEREARRDVLFDSGMAFYSRLDRERPDLTRAAARPGRTRGIDFYRAAQLPPVLGLALHMFRGEHGRWPDLVRMPATVDHHFAIKFFEPLEVSPRNPSDKLEAHRYLPPDLADAVLLPRRPWVSSEPELPPDDAVPPGRWMLKPGLGNAAMLPVDWPPDAETRAEAARLMRSWNDRRHGFAWGEWWYSASPQRYFLEEDLSARIVGRPEYRVYVREGRAMMLYTILYDGQKGQGTARVGFHDGALGRLSGRTMGRPALDLALPDWAPRMMEVAGAVGRGFRFLRVDFYDLGADRPGLGELTVCDFNARRRYDPPEFDAEVARLLFG